MSDACHSAALVPNTLVGEVSRLLQQPPETGETHAPVGALRLFDLFSLIEALVLHDRLYTLPARPNASRESLELRRSLVGEGILAELDTRADHEDVSRLLLDGLANVRDPKVLGRPNESERVIDYERQVRGDVEAFLLSDPGITEHFMRPPNLFDEKDEFLVGGMLEQLPASSFEDFARALIGWIEYRGSDCYEACTSILRDMYYIFMSEHKRMPYWPHSNRVALARRFANSFDADLRSRLYKRLAQDLQTETAEMERIFGPQTMFIPPFSAIVLDRSRTRADVIGQILAVRTEFHYLRTQMRDLDAEMRQAKTFGSMKKVVKKQARLEAKLVERFGRSNWTLLERGIRWSPAVAEVAVSPADPTKWAAAVLSLPFELLLEQLATRPVAMFFVARAKVDRIEDYQGLVGKVFPEIKLDRSNAAWLVDGG